VISGKTNLLPLFGYPTAAFKAPLIYNPWFDKQAIDAVVVPMGVTTEDFPTVLKSVFRLTNIPGALVTMPHKVSTVALLDECSTSVKIAGSCHAILKRSDGTLLGDMFDGTGFTRGLRRKGFVFAGATGLWVRANDNIQGDRKNVFVMPRWLDQDNLFAKASSRRKPGSSFCRETPGSAFPLVRFRLSPE
jgi:shikimate dehydrogenase